MKLTVETNVRANDQIVARQVVDEYILVPMYGSSDEVDCIFNLNQVGTDIWEKLSGEKRIGSLIDELMELYDGDRAVVESDVLAFLDELVAAGIITVVNDAGN